MAESAHVSSIDALKELRRALATFIEEGKQALLAVDMENRRVRDWVVNQQRLYWIEEVKRRREKLAQARTELHRKKLVEVSRASRHDAEQVEAVRVAQARLREGEEKIEIVKKWAIALQQELDVYKSRSRALADMLDGDLVHALGRLDNMITALEEYARLSPPV